MKKLIWTIIVTFGLASLSSGGTALAGQGHKAATRTGEAGKHHKNK